MSDTETSQPQKSEEELNRESIEVWVQELTRYLDIDVEVDIDALLKLAGVAAHTVVRPAAPVTTFVIGYVAGLAEASGQHDGEHSFQSAVDAAERLLDQRSRSAD